MSSSPPTSVWTKMLVYLGLWEEPESYEASPVEQPAADRERGPAFGDEGSNVRPLRLAPTVDSTRTEIVEVASFEDCETIGRRYRDGSPVLFDLSGVDKTTARRVIDFVSGATYVLHGSLTRVASRAFLLVPDGVVVADDERGRLEARGYRLADGA